MNANAFAARAAASEGQWFATEQRLAIIRRLERMVEAVSTFNFFFITHTMYLCCFKKTHSG